MALANPRRYQQYLNAVRQGFVAVNRYRRPIIKAGRVARQLYNEFSSNPGRPSKQPRTASRTEGMEVEGPSKKRYRSSSGVYKGSFKKPRRAPKRSAYAMRGIQREDTYKGQQSQNSCAYIGIRSLVPNFIGYDVGAAFIRYIMKKHYQKEYTNISQQLQEGDTQQIYKLDFFRRQKLESNGSEDAVVLFATFTFQGAETVDTFAVWFTENVFNSSLVSTLKDDEYRYLHAYRFTERDYIADTGTNIEHVQAFNRVDDMYLKVYSVGNLTIQNITPADDDNASDLLTTRIDQNPLKGKCYKINGPVPVFGNTNADPTTGTNADNDNELVDDPNDDGVIYPQGAVAGNMRTPPQAHNFKYCNGVATVAMNPGEMKRASISFKYDGKLTRLIEGVNHSRERLRGKNKGFGTCLLFALEKRLRTGDIDQVVVNWQVRYNHGAVIKKVVKRPLDKVVKLQGEPIEN